MGHGAQVVTHQESCWILFRQEDGGDGSWNAPRRASQLACSENGQGAHVCDRCSMFFRFTAQLEVHGRFDLMFLSSG